MLSTIPLFATLSFLSLPPLIASQCRCVPDQDCWPSIADWSSFNTTIAGKLIQTTPIAVSCYSGILENATECATVNTLWTSPIWQAEQPIGYDYPTNRSCPVVKFGAATGTCTLGNSPVYAVNVTEVDDIVRSIQFAKKKNIRLVIKSTGHDLLMRSTGYGSLLVWLYNFRHGYEFFDRFQSINHCSLSSWTGGALTIRGAYSWSDLYPTAAEKKLIIVGGVNGGPCSTGGWTQGGGHSSASRSYGLGADQVLSAKVVLASGEYINVSPCSHPDLFTAIRGGGGGTYGIVTEITVKTYPTTNINALNITVKSPTANTTAFLNAMTLFYSSYPYLSNAGFSGYGSWSINTTTYTHSLALFGSNASEVARRFAPVAEKLTPLNSSELNITLSQEFWPDYSSFYDVETNTATSHASTGAFVTDNRLLDGPALTGNLTLLRETLEIVSGTPDQNTFLTVFVHGGAVLAAGRHGPYSSVQPGWRRSYVMNIIARLFPATDFGAIQQGVQDDVRITKMDAFRKLAPDTGSYERG